MSDKIFKIRKDIERARNILDISKDRFGLIGIYPKDKVYKIVEEYYESIKEILLSLMYFEGFKTLSHIEMLNWFSKQYGGFSETEIKLIDILRKLRNGSLYYGDSANKMFLDNNEKNICDLINKLTKFAEEKFL